ncbi:stress-induced acidophilic repeat motif-containing protein, partial [Salmonella enterica]|nr:stress-induced acidophilic repeat motif-containing protein [Salmonella enterica]EBM4764104.1 stress-induced acidophilic repeat motif-containing protein [Salmonella enterica]
MKTDFFSKQRDRRNNMAEHRGGSGNFAEN